MKRFSLFLMSLLFIGLGMFAQKNLNISKVFGGKYVTDPQVSETVMTGDHRLLRKRNLTTLATFSGPYDKYAAMLQPLVLKDGQKATGRDVRYKNGKLEYSFFILPPTTVDGKKVNRYLYYLNNESRKQNGSVILIYFDGTIDRFHAETLINSLRKD